MIANNFIRIKDTNLFFDPVNDTARYGNSGYIMRPLSPDFVGRSCMKQIKDKDAFYLGSLSGITCEILSTKLEYINFKNYEIKTADFERTEDNIHQLYLKRDYIEFSDEADYAYFCILFSDLIDFKNMAIML